ncbi:hypothetical protein E2562_011607 [Oryza meyeriana var. granulata]|uniref:DUF834 domain-containing protein n=1 Tax=Oryza meyeriana var. granulata TaxID=110450 RepID=A0A6G1DYL6_9ORYZ|nr:hypothetical protein E2562_011607 [Oryza meyeriana var. granulata]
MKEKQMATALPSSSPPRRRSSAANGSGPGSLLLATVGLVDAGSNELDEAAGDGDGNGNGELSVTRAKVEVATVSPSKSSHCRRARRWLQRRSRMGEEGRLQRRLRTRVGYAGSKRHSSGSRRE